MPAQADLERLRAVKTLPSLIAYLRDTLDWPIDQDAVADDFTFEYNPEELGFDTAAAVYIKEIKQLRPLDARQPWGIFWVNFEKKRLPVVMLRRILGHLVLKKRASARQAGQRVWQLHDLLFISAYGEDSDRAVSFAHFSHDPESPGDLPVLKVLGWNDGDTVLHIADAYQALTEKLHWPAQPANLNAWRNEWRSAFTLRHREVIETTAELVEELARLADATRRRANTILARESERGPLRRLCAAFRAALIHDLTEDDFADVIAQTISYGLLIARFSRPAGIAVQNLVDMVPPTNPFLRELLGMFLTLAGRKGVFDFDELGIQDVVELLNRAKADAVKADFGKRTRNEDPVIHFYEHFLAAYDRQKKIQRGVFYTPQPVVSYIVRSVHELLQKEFGIEDGLASTITWGEMLKTHPGLKLPRIRVPKAGKAEGEEVDLDPNEPFVMILDIATGTATFLVEVIEVIFQQLQATWDKGGASKMPAIPLSHRMGGSGVRASASGRGEGAKFRAFTAYWNAYVPNALLPRLYGYELMMAPYTIAHMKLALKFSEINARLGQADYLFKFDGRAHIYLTNTLEPARGFVTQEFADFFPALAHEAAAVNDVKRRKRFTVVIGNPPYSASISEPDWLMRLLDDWKQGLNETKSDLNREEWKFLRLAQYHCQTTGAGILGFVINRDFLDGIVKRRMREHLGQSFPLRVAVDLNGDVKGNIADENVFEIEQGVAIAVLCTHHANPSLRFASRVGTREEKYADLVAKKPIDAALVDTEAPPPYFRWVPYSSEHTAGAAAEYSEWPEIKSAFGIASSGIQTKRDGLCVAFTRSEMWEHVQRFHALPAERAREEFDLGEDGRDWTVTLAKADIAVSGPNQQHLCPILYRPFDIRFTYWTGKTKGFLAYPRREVMQHVVGRKNVGMIFNRQIVGDSVSHFGVSRIPICHGTFYLGNKGQDYFAPLLAFDDDLLASQKSGRSNFTLPFLNALRKAAGAEAAKLTPEDIFHYAYAVFHSPGYRSRYAEFLKIDFPRLPLTGNLELFRALARLGGELTALHLLESPNLADPITEFIGGRNPEVEKVSWSKNNVWLDKAQTTGFNGVREDVWNFHIGGYQVCEKWLKDRRGRTLPKEDLAHYHKIVIALSETIRLMDEIDEVIDKAGGWPGAFAMTQSRTTVTGNDT